MENNKIQIPETNQELTLQGSTTSLINMLEQNNTLELIKYQSSVKLEMAINGDQLSKIKRMDEAGLTKAVKNLVVNLTQSINLTNPITDAQVFEITLLTIENYYYLKLDELVLIFKNAKLGKYGKIYNRLDVQIVFEWVETYLKSEERIMYFEKENKGKPELETPDMKKVYEEYMSRKVDPEKVDVDENYRIAKEKYYKERILKDGNNPG